MGDKILHVTNGDGFTNRLKELLPDQDILTWNEILCEGPSSNTIFSEDFITERVEYLKIFTPNAEEKYQKFVSQFEILKQSSFDQFIFWFEYDLFCHINMAAVITYVHSIAPNAVFYLVCSGVIHGKEGLYGLSELSEPELWKEYKNKILLNMDAIATLKEFWNIYTSDDHSTLTSIAFNAEQFPYFSSCIQVHLERFPNIENGLNALELQVLQAIDTHEFESIHKLVGYLLRNQGYYGFGDSQWFLIVENLKLYFTEETNLQLTARGKSILEGKQSALTDLANTSQFGRCAKYNYLYNSSKQAIQKR